MATMVQRHAKPATDPVLTGLNTRYDEAILIGFTATDVEVIIKPAPDGALNKTRLLNTLHQLVHQLEIG